MTHQTTRRAPRAAQAIATVRVAREIHLLCPDAATVTITPVWTDRTGQARLAHVVTIRDAYGRATGSRAAHRVAHRAVRQQHTRADWRRAHIYTVPTGRLAPMAAPTTPAEMGDA